MTITGSIGIFGMLPTNTVVRSVASGSCYDGRRKAPGSARYRRRL
jgi:hypothetical protein